MTVSIANRIVSSPAGISELGRLALGFVDGGTQWLDWAIHDAGARYHFADESAFLAGVQTGLHGSPFALLPTLGLMVSPVKLMTISAADLRTLATAEAGGKGASVPAQVKRILRAHGLVTQADLAGVQPFLDGLKVAAAPVFHGTGFGDRLALLELISADRKAPAALQAEAAAFAVEQGRNSARIRRLLSGLSGPCRGDGSAGRHAREARGTRPGPPSPRCCRCCSPRWIAHASAVWSPRGKCPPRSRTG